VNRRRHLRRRYPAARFYLIGIYGARREETIRGTQWLSTTTHPWMNLDAMVYQAWEGILEDAGLGDDVVRHSLRHTAATWLITSPGNIAPRAGSLALADRHRALFKRSTILVNSPNLLPDRL
jgi:integrase